MLTLAVQQHHRQEWPSDHVVECAIEVDQHQSRELELA